MSGRAPRDTKLEQLPPLPLVRCRKGIYVFFPAGQFSLHLHHEREDFPSVSYQRVKSLTSDLLPSKLGKEELRNQVRLFNFNFNVHLMYRSTYATTRARAHTFGTIFQLPNHNTNIRPPRRNTSMAFPRSTAPSPPPLIIGGGVIFIGGSGYGVFVAASVG